MIGLRENAASAILSLCPALSNKTRCGRRFDGAPFLCFGRIDFHASEANVRLFPTHASEFRHTAGGYQRKLEKEESFVPFLFVASASDILAISSSERTRSRSSSTFFVKGLRGT